MGEPNKTIKKFFKNTLVFYCNSQCVTHDQLKRDIYIKEHRYACKNWSTDPDFSRHGFHFPSTSVPPGTFFRLWNPPTSYMVPYGYTPQSKAHRHSHLTTLHPYRRQSNNNWYMHVSKKYATDSRKTVDLVWPKKLGPVYYTRFPPLSGK